MSGNAKPLTLLIARHKLLQSLVIQLTSVLCPGHQKLGGRQTVDRSWRNAAVQPLKLIVQRIEAGKLANFLAVNKAGELLQFQ